MKSHARILFITFVLVIISIFFSLCKGSMHFTDENVSLIFKLRLPRTITAFVSGGLLALAGAFMQLLLQNPLADPYVLGISGGAALGAILTMFLGLGMIWLVGGAWIGSLLAMLFIFLLAKKHLWQSHTLLLCGVALACGFSAFISLILLISSNADLHNMLFWLTGDLNSIDMPWLGLTILAFGLLISIGLAPGLNILSRGELEASALGLSTKQYRVGLYLLSSLFTATAVTLVGCIGFLGLIIPHTTRLLVGFDHRIVLPVSAFLGGILLIIADTLARSLIAPEQLPVGIFMALIGVPIFIWLLQK